jgi:uncharacterized membrane protein YhaH (DUF805 family)
MHGLIKIKNMTFTESIKTCFKKCFDYKGRASRSEFWWFWLFYIIIMNIFNIIVRARFQENTGFYIFVISCGVIILAILLALVSAFVRRLHDTNRSGWWLLLWIFIMALFLITAKKQLFVLSIILSIVFLIDTIILIVWLCQDGDYDANKYGERNE